MRKGRRRLTTRSWPERRLRKALLPRPTPPSSTPHSRDRKLTFPQNPDGPGAVWIDAGRMDGWMLDAAKGNELTEEEDDEEGG